MPKEGARQSLGRASSKRKEASDAEREGRRTIKNEDENKTKKKKRKREGESKTQKQNSKRQGRSEKATVVADVVLPPSAPFAWGRLPFVSGIRFVGCGGGGMWRTVEVPTTKTGPRAARG